MGFLIFLGAIVGIAVVGALKAASSSFAGKDPILEGATDSIISPIDLAGDKSLPLGVRNKNPGNLKDVGIKWLGRIGANQSFTVFSSEFYGIRAMTIDLIGDITKDKLNTFILLMSSYIQEHPLGDKIEYAKFTSAACGKTYQAAIDWQLDGPRLIRAIISFENRQPGTNQTWRSWYGDVQINAGYDAGLQHLGLA